MEGTIYNQILSYRQYPRNLFAGSEARIQNLLYAIQAGGSQ